MNEYIEFLEENYKNDDKINILSFVSGKVRNKILPIANMKKASGTENIDVYMSMNPLVRKNKIICRDKEHIGRLNWLYVDLDYYHSAYKDFTKQQIIGLLEMDYFDKEIPVPAYIIDSGRGLYLLWKIDEHINAYPRWVTMQNYLCSKLKEFGADRKVSSDSARVLRCVGSINSKSGSMVKIIWQTKTKYSLTNLFREYIVDSAPSAKMVAYAKNISKILEIDLPDMKDRQAVKKYIQANKEPANLFSKMKQVKKRKSKIAYINTEYSLLYSRVTDLEKLLLKYRDQEGGFREYILFLYRYWQLCITNEKETSLTRTLQLNEKLKQPLSEKEVIQATRSAEKYYDAGKVFRCSNAYVVEALHITSEEMKSLSVFISPEERALRKQERNKNAYLSTLKKLGKITAEEKIKLRRKKISKMLNRGLSCKEVCQRLQISRATFYSDKQEVERLLAMKKDKQEKVMQKYQEYCHVMRERCLKISAFVLNMSFRTCGASLLTVSQLDVLSQRALLSWGRSYFAFLSHYLLKIPIVNDIDILHNVRYDDIRQIGGVNYGIEGSTESSWFDAC